MGHKEYLTTSDADHPNVNPYPCIAVGITLQQRTGMPRVLIRPPARSIPSIARSAETLQTSGWTCCSCRTPVFRSQATSKPTLSGAHPKPQGDIVIDGICGDQTIGFVEYFQEQMQLKFQEVELNGQVVPWRIMGALTIGLLNGGLSHLPQPPMLNQFGAFPDELWDSFYL